MVSGASRRLQHQQSCDGEDREHRREAARDAQETLHCLPAFRSIRWPQSAAEHAVAPDKYSANTGDMPIRPGS
ncbi:hypothetical protein GCM10009762_22890 [Dermacoccus barathri]|uniref:Uncharacterized protein n=1 Tax=Dermacoccus barathri TaxID=322601 RepID=A0ABN2C076_9MICO